MNEILTHYMTGDSEDFQDFLEHDACTEDDKLDAILKIGQNGWDECLEILVSRDDPVLQSNHAAQAWVYMASEGHTDTWMQMLPTFFQMQAINPLLWSEALDVGKNDAAIDGHWECYALAKALEDMVANKTQAPVAQMALIGMRIELMHGMDSSSAGREIADAFAIKHVAQASQTKNVDNVFSEMNFE